MESSKRDYLVINNAEIKSLREVATETLRDAIISGYLKPGEHLKERDLSEKMGISTTPIKEAIRILGYEGLIETVPRKGNYVSKHIDSSIEEILFFRARLEGFAVRLITLKFTDQEIAELEKDILAMEEALVLKDHETIVEINNNFHTKIRNGTRNPLISNMLTNVASFDYSFRKRALAYNEEIEIGIREHRSIFEAIKNRDPDLAEERMIKHIERSARNVLQHVNNGESN